VVRQPRGAAGTKTSAVDRGSGPYRPQTAGPRSRRRSELFGDARPASAGRGGARPAGRADARARLLARVDPHRGRERTPRIELHADPAAAARSDAHARAGVRRDRPRAGAERAHPQDAQAASADRPPARRRRARVLRYAAAALGAGFALAAFLQLMRVYGQARRSTRLAVGGMASSGRQAPQRRQARADLARDGRVWRFSARYERFAPRWRARGASLGERCLRVLARRVRYPPLARHDRLRPSRPGQPPSRARRPWPQSPRPNETDTLSDVVREHLIERWPETLMEVDLSSAVH